MTGKPDCLRFVLGLAVLCLLVAPAKGAELLDSTAALAIAGDEILPATVQELAETRQTTATVWRNAAVGDATLVYAYVQTGRRFEPTYWLVSVQSGDELVGALALDPMDGHFSWRATTIPAQFRAAYKELFSFETADAIAIVEKTAGKENIKKYEVEHVNAVSVNGVLYWVVPTRSEDVHDSLCVKVGSNAEAIPLWKAIATGLGVLPAQGRAAASALPRDIPPAASASSEKETWLVGEVPRYIRTDPAVGWAHGLAMVNQWWAPKSMGSGDDQAARFRKAAAASDTEAVYLHRIYDLVATWSTSDDFPSFETLWFGQGHRFSPEGPTSWTSQDPRAWIAWEAPVLVTVDADGKGPGEGVDHLLALTGYSSKHQTIYVNNPWGIADAFSYGDFNQRYWGAYYSIKCGLPSLCTKKTKARRGMLGLIPGDLQGPPTPVPQLAVPQAAPDAKSISITSVGARLTAPLVPGFGGKDFFGEKYQTSCVVIVPKGMLDGNPEQGDWTKVQDKESDEGLTVSLATEKTLYAGTLVSGGRFDVSFPDAEVGDVVEMSTVCKVHDENDRSHFQQGTFINVVDDSEESEGKKRMKKPILASAGREQKFKISISDDDPAPPTIRMVSPGSVYDSQKSAYRFKVIIDDWSGVGETAVAWTSEDTPPDQFASFSEQKGREYWIDIPREKWIQSVGKQLKFRVRAVDKDSDRDEDASTAVADFTVAVEDDDAQGPSVVQYVVERKENNQFQVLVKLEDASGILVTASWPKLYYSFSQEVSLDHFNGVTKLVKDASHGEGWFTAVAPWGEQGIEEDEDHKGKKKDTIIFFKVRAVDLDDDRKKDGLDSWSAPWWEVYLPAQVAEERVLTDIWPGGEDAAIEGVWDNWFENPPKGLPSGLFIGPPPNQDAPPAVPDLLPGGDSRLRLHIYVQRLVALSGAKLTIQGSSVGSQPFSLRISLVSRKGTRLLKIVSLATEDDGGSEIQVPLPKEVLSTGENVLVFESDKMPEDASLRIERILVDY
jgi:hypothetical protein